MTKLKKSSSPEPLGQFQPNLAQKGIQVSTNEEPINSHEVNNWVFFLLNQHFDINICV